MIKNYKIHYNQDIEFVRAFHTNGHEWCLYEIHENYVKRTSFFKPKMVSVPINYTPKFYDDYSHIQAVIGLIRFAMNIEDNIVLRSSTYKLDEKSEEILIQNREAVSSLNIDSPNVIQDVGLNKNLLERKNNYDSKLIGNNNSLKKND